MATTIALPGTLARQIGRADIVVDADTLGQALSQLTREHQLGDAIIDAAGRLQPYIRIVLGGAVLPSQEADDLARVDVQNTRVELKTAFAGG